MSTPLVSICCLTFNHVDYIEKCIEGFLIQKTSFVFEILIRDDCSTDGTSEICKKYSDKYPTLIKLLTYEENQWNKGIRPLKDALDKVIGKYVAVCEGDDYWIDPYKLQKQFDFLEQNTDCSLCFHPCFYLFNDNVLKISKPDFIPNNSKYNIDYIFNKEGGAIATNSIFFLKIYTINFPNWYFKSNVGDLPLFLLLASNGKIGYIHEIMGVYRFMSHNSWSEKFFKNLKFRIQNYISIINMYYSFNKYTNNKFIIYVYKNIFRCYFKIIATTLFSIFRSLFYFPPFQFIKK